MQARTPILVNQNMGPFGRALVVVETASALASLMEWLLSWSYFYFQKYLTKQLQLVL
jgi:hypothetical protein